jgi:hypothetical protein
MPGHFMHICTARRAADLLANPETSSFDVAGTPLATIANGLKPQDCGAIMRHLDRFTALGAVGPDLSGHLLVLDPQDAQRLGRAGASCGATCCTTARPARWPPTYSSRRTGRRSTAQPGTVRPVPRRHPGLVLPHRHRRHRALVRQRAVRQPVPDAPPAPPRHREPHRRAQLSRLLSGPVGTRPDVAAGSEERHQDLPDIDRSALVFSIAIDDKNPYGWRTGSPTASSAYMDRR